MHLGDLPVSDSYHFLRVDVDAGRNFDFVVASDVGHSLREKIEANGSLESDHGVVDTVDVAGGLVIELEAWVLNRGRGVVHCVELPVIHKHSAAILVWQYCYFACFSAVLVEIGVVYDSYDIVDFIGKEWSFQLEFWVVDLIGLEQLGISV